MSGNFVHCKRERQRIVYIYNIILYILHFWAAYDPSKSLGTCNLEDGQLHLLQVVWLPRLLGFELLVQS